MLTLFPKTRNRYGDFSTNPAISKSDQSRAFQGGSLGQNFAASNNWDGGIWGNAAIGSVLRSGTNDNGRSQRKLQKYCSSLNR